MVMEFLSVERREQRNVTERGCDENHSMHSTKSGEVRSCSWLPGCLGSGVNGGKSLNNERPLCSHSYEAYCSLYVTLNVQQH